MARKGFLALMLICGAVSNIAYGDGKFFGLEKVPVGVPYQRAILLYKGGKETLILQSKYKTAADSDGNSIGWIVPVPTVPELASMDASGARMLFFLQNLRSQPTVIPVVPLAIYLGIVVLIGLLTAKVLNWFSAKLIKAGAKPLIVSGFRIAIGLIVGFILIVGILMPSLGKRRGEVDVLKAETVGIYDVKVIRGDDAGAVTHWLRGNGFGFGETDTKVFDQYVNKGWCFVAAKVNRKADIKSSEAMSEGLAAPLILSFDTKEAVYPMRLTGTAGTKTEILLYVLAEHKMDCGDKLKLAFAGEASISFDNRNSFGVEPNGFFEKAKSEKWYLSKFKGTLKPEQMTDDIVFTQAKDNKPYRKIRWW